MRKRLRVYALGFVGAGILLIVIYLIFCRLEPVEIILTLTAVIIYVYTYETYELRRATVDHTEIYTRPVLILRMDLDNRDQKVFLRLHNHGHSPAYNVEFKETELNMEMPEGYQWKLKLEDVDVVPPEKEILVSLASGPDESIYEWVTSEQLFSRINSTRVRHGRYSFKTIAVYEDILGHTWKSELGFNSTFGIIAKKPDAIERKTRAQKKGGETD